MKVLLDECVPAGFRLHLRGHVVPTAGWAGFKGLKNGEPIKRAASEGYGVLITVDEGIPRGHAIERSGLAVILMESATNQLEDLVPAADNILRELEVIQPGQVAVIAAGR